MNQHQMPGEPPATPELPEWIPFDDPRPEHRAAHGAWLHAPTLAVLVKFWFGATDTYDIKGEWVFELRVSGQKRAVLCVASDGADVPAPVAFEAAKRVMREMSCGSAKQPGSE